MARYSKMLNFPSLKNPLNRADSELSILWCLFWKCLTFGIYCTLRKRVNRIHVAFLNWNPHRIVVGQHTWNQVSIHVPFLRREISEGWDLSVFIFLFFWPFWVYFSTLHKMYNLAQTRTALRVHTWQQISEPSRSTVHEREHASDWRVGRDGAHSAPPRRCEIFRVTVDPVSSPGLGWARRA